MDEYFKGHALAVAFLNGPDIHHGTFPGQNSQVDPQFLRMINPSWACERHLRGGMDGEIRAQVAYHVAKPNVLNDDCIHIDRHDRSKLLLYRGKFISEDQCIHGHITTNSMTMKEGHDRWQVLQGKIISPHPGVEPGQSKINGVRSIGNGSLEAFPITSRSQ